MLGLPVAIRGRARFPSDNGEMKNDRVTRGEVRENDELGHAWDLAVAAVRGSLGLLLVRLARRVLPEEGVVVEEVEEAPTAPIRPPRVR